MIKKERHIKKRIQMPHPIIVVSAILFTASFAGRLYIASVMASKNIDLRETYARKTELVQEISKLEYEELQVSSLSSIEQKAQKLGFVPLNGLLSSIDLDASYPIALR